MANTFQALENKGEIRSSLKKLKSQFCNGAEKKAWKNGNIYWHEQHSCWGYFDISPSETRYWIPFGKVNNHYRKNMIVEINPPVSGINTSVQGLIAKDEKGNRWLMHQSRLHPPGVRISQEMFDQIYLKERINVSFSEGGDVGYHKVACLDGSSDRLVQDLSEYVCSCRKARTYWTEKTLLSHSETVLRDSEKRFSGEPNGKSFMPGRKGRVFVRTHGTVVNELASLLENKGLEVDNRYNKRRLGPDLRAFRNNHQPLLFEVKTQLNMNNLYCAIGQLSVYNELEQDDFQRIVVFPAQFDATLKKVLKSLGVEVLPYEMSRGGKISFKASTLNKILNK